MDKAITHRQIWLLAGPLILSNISVPLVGIVDTAVIGHMQDANGIGAVALGALIFSFLYWGFGFLRMSTTGFVARAFGSQSQQDIQLIFARAALLAILFASIIILFSKPLLALAMLALQSTDQIESAANEYASIRILSAPATLVIYVMTGVMIGMQRTGQAMVLQLVMNITNVILDYAFVVLWHLGVAGVAWASLIAEYSAMLCGVWLLRKLIVQSWQQVDRKAICEKAALISMLHNNGHIFIRTLCLVTAFALFTNISAYLGALVLAANAILIHFMSMAAYALDGFALAAETTCGAAYGAKDAKTFRLNVKLSSLWAAFISIAITLFYGFFGQGILHGFTDLPEVIELALEYLPWMIIAPILSFASYQLDGIFIGCGFTSEMVKAMLVSCLFYLISLFILVPLLGNHGLYLALMLFMMMRAATLWYFYPKIVSGIKKPR